MISRTSLLTSLLNGIIRAPARTWLIGLAVATAAFAYDLRTDDSGVYTSKWYESPVELLIKMSSTANLSDGRSLSSSVRDAATTWNQHLQTVQFNASLTGSGTRTGGNGINELVIASTIDGDAFGEQTLAVTISYYQGNESRESDIVFNGGEDWDSYTGNVRTRPDIHRVALHELGHVLGLDHPDEAGQFVTAIMNSRMSAIDALQSDDIAGGQHLYGAPGVVPANDNFANAFELRGILSPFVADANNVNASRETGEPNHADVVTGHSLWWYWTSPVLQTVNLDTDGSDYDTVLAVYTGASFDSLTLVASNDDEETPEQNPTPTRKRTSKVTFTAQANTTYAIAVDGWGDPERFPQGSTGFTKLRLFFDPPNVAPTITFQPTNSSPRAGETAYFSILVEGRPTPTAQWQRRAAGTTAWVNVVDDGTYTGATDTVLSIRSIYAMNGDAFRCVVTNSEGQAITSVVSLFVIPDLLPEFTRQPVDITLNDGEAGLLSAYSLSTETYQWYRNDQPIPGANRADLHFPSPSPLDAGVYYLVVTNPTGSTTSRSATVTVIAPPAVSNIGTRRQFASAASIEPLRVTAVGSSSLSYQWVRNGRPITGAVSPTYQPSGDARSLPGTYWARVTDDNGTRNSEPFFILPAPTQTRINTYALMSNLVSDAPLSVTDAIVGSIGSNSGLVIRSDGRLAAWGYPAKTGTDQLSGITDAAGIAVGRLGAVILHEDGTVTGTGNAANPPAALDHVVAVAAGAEFALALRSNGTVVAWNANSTSAYAPPAGLTDVVAIAAGWYHALALKSDGSVVAWSDRDDPNVTTVPNDLPKVTALAAGIDHSLALLENGTVVGWGDNGSRQLNTPAGLANVIAIAAGARHSVALRADGSVVTWGAFPTDQTSGLARLPPAFAIAAGGDYTMALVETAPDTDTRLVNLSVRSNAGKGEQTLVMGFVVSGDSAQSILVRGIGPTLSQFGVANALSDPSLRVFDSTTDLIAYNFDWPFPDTQLISTSAELGAFALTPGSLDAAVLRNFSPGAYSAHVENSDARTGIALIEVYDATLSGPTRLSNVSARTVVGTGDGVLVAGFVLKGEAPKRLLIRGIGPALANYGVAPGSLISNPVLKVFQGTTELHTNDDWAGSTTIAEAAALVGAFPLPDANSRDAALLVTLDPGAYTVQVTNANEGSGVALVEIYALP